MLHLIINLTPSEIVRLGSMKMKESANLTISVIHRCTNRRGEEGGDTGLKVSFQLKAELPVSYCSKIRHVSSLTK